MSTPPFPISVDSSTPTLLSEFLSSLLEPAMLEDLVYGETLLRVVLEDALEQVSEHSLFVLAHLPHDYMVGVAVPMLLSWTGFINGNTTLEFSVPITDARVGRIGEIAPLVRQSSVDVALYVSSKHLSRNI